MAVVQVVAVAVAVTTQTQTQTQAPGTKHMRGQVKKIGLGSGSKKLKWPEDGREQRTDQCNTGKAASSG